ncbi:MAG: hypothetical protein IJG17_08475, partial [Eubacterium sp.]|nr:hypothetical protein [Eubacterium sp.]
PKSETLSEETDNPYLSFMEGEGDSEASQEVSPSDALSQQPSDEGLLNESTVKDTPVSETEGEGNSTADPVPDIETSNVENDIPEASSSHAGWYTPAAEEIDSSDMSTEESDPFQKLAELLTVRETSVTANPESAEDKTPDYTGKHLSE